MRYLLDTNILSDLVRHPQGQIMQHIERVGEGQVCTRIVVARSFVMEQRRGSRRA